MSHKNIFFAAMLVAACSTLTPALADDNVLGLSSFPRIESTKGTPARAPENLTTDFITEAEGVTIRYASKGLQNSPYGLIPQAGYKTDLTFSADGETVYIPQLVPHAGKPGTYLKGTLGTNEARQHTLTVKANQLINRFDTFDEYMIAKVGETAQQYADSHDTTVEALKQAAGWNGPMNFYFVPAKPDSKGEKAVLLDEYVLTENAGGVFMPDPAYDMLYLFSWYYGGPEGYIAAAANISLQKITNEACEVPAEGVEWKRFAHQWDAAAFEDGWQMCSVGFKGDKVYIPGLIPDIHEAYAEGTIDSDGIITINPDPLFILDDTIYYHCILPVDQTAMYDMQFNISYLEAYPNYQLKYDRENGTMLPLNDMKLIDFYCYDQNVDIYQHKYKLYEQDTPATPATPFHLGFHEGSGTEWFAFEMPSVDVEGWVINPDKISYQCFLNGDMQAPYQFTASKYVNLKEDTTEIPLLFNDDYDFVYDRGWVYVYWYEPAWHSFGVRACYDVDGVKNYSDVTWVENPNSSVEAISADAADGPAYDVLGRKVAPGYKGIVIRNNKKYIQK